MSTCPFCHAKLSQTDLDNAVCPSCEKTLSDALPADASTDVRSTIDESADDSARMQTDELAFEDGSADQPSTAGKQTIADDAATNGSSDIQQTIDENTDEQGTVGEDISQTIDTSRMPASAGKQTIADDDLQSASPSEMRTMSDDESSVNSDMPEMNTMADEPFAPDDKGTVDEIPSPVADERQTVGDDASLDSLQSEDESGTVGDAIGATFEVDQFASAQVDPHQGTIDDRGTVDDPDVEDGKEDLTTKTVDAAGIGQTMDVSQLAQDEPERTPGGTIIGNRIDQTVELPDDADGEGTVPDRAIGSTLDSTDLEQHLGHTWQGTIGDDATPNTSLKAELGETKGKSKLVVQQREFCQPDEPHLGQSDYDLIKLLGEGGMGMVYSARQASIDRTVAVKMLKPKTASDETQRNKFLAEAVVTGDLEHPNIVPIYDLGKNNQGSLFYAMKRVQGTPWDNVIAEKSLPENIEIFMKVADAVGFAHSRKIIHRDLKPENVMLGSYGEVLVMDWGLAIPTDRRDLGGIKPSLSMGGTPAYMAPEMAAGPFDRIGTHSDIYLLGAILYEIITGKPPHTGRDVMKCLFAAAKNSIVPTNKTGELVEIANKAMATKPEDRYETVTAMQDAIREYLAHSESIAMASRAAVDLTQAGSSNDYEDFSRAMFGFQQALDLWDQNERAKTGLAEARLAYATSAKDKGDLDLAASLLDEVVPEHNEILGEIRLAKAEIEARQHRLKRMRRVIQVGVASFLVVVLGFSGWVWIERSAALDAREIAVKAKGEAEQQRDRANELREIADEERQKAVDALTEAELQTILALFSRQEAGNEEWKAERARLEEVEQRKIADTQRREAELQRIEAIFSQQEAGNEEWIANVARAEEEKQREIAEAQRREAELQRIVAIFSEQEAGNAEWIAIVAKEEAIVAKEAEAYEAYVARIVAAFEKIEDNAYSRARELLRQCIPQGGARDYRGWEWGRLAYLCGLSVKDFPLGVPINCVAFSPDGTRFATGDATGKVKVWDYAGKILFEIQPDNTPVQAIAFSPKGGLLATGTNANRDNIRIWDQAGGKPVKTLSGESPHIQGVTSLTFSRDGKRLVSTSFDKTAKLWDIAGGIVERTFKGHDGPQGGWVWDAALSPDESQLVTVGQDGRAIVWSVESGDPLPTFLGHNGLPIYAVAFAPDGKTVATAGYDKRVLLWSPSDLTEFDFDRAAKAYAEQLERGIANPDISNVSPPKYKALDGHMAAVKDVVISQYGDQTLIVSSGLDNTIKLWNMNSGQLVRTFRGHGEPVLCCDVSPDVQWVVSGSNDGFAKLWNIEGYRESQVLKGKVLKGHTEAVLWAEFSKDGRHILTASQDRTAIKWTRDGKRVVEFREGHEYLTTRVVPFANGMRLATAARDNTVRVWDTISGTQKYVLDGTGRSAALAVSPDGKWILTGGNGLFDEKNERIMDPTSGEPIVNARLWDAATGKLVFELPLPKMVNGERVYKQQHHKPITSAAISIDSRLLCTGDGNGRCNLWDLTNGKLIKTLSWHNGRITAVAFHGDGKRLLTASHDMNVAQWDLSTLKVIDALTLVHRPHGEVTALALSNDKRHALTVCSDGKLRLWDVDTAKVVRLMIPVGPDGKPLIGKRTFNDVAISADGKHALAVESQSKTLRVFDVANGQELRFKNSNATDSSFIQSSDVFALWAATFSSDGNKIITVGGEEAVTWNFDAEKRTSPRAGMSFRPHSIVSSASFSEDEKFVVTVGRDNSIRVWNAQSAKGVFKLEGLHDRRINTAVFSPDGEEILTASEDGTAKIVNVTTKEVVATIANHKAGLTLAVFSPDGDRVLTASRDGTAQIWVRETKNSVVLPHKKEVLHAAFSKDGKWVITGSADNLARIWNAVPMEISGTKKAIGEVSVDLRGHTAPVQCVAFSPDLRCAITGSADNTAKVWDTTKLADEGQPLAKEVLTLGGHAQPVTAVTFSSDGRLVLTGSRDGTAIVWEATTWDRKDLAINID